MSGNTLKIGQMLVCFSVAPVKIGIEQYVEFDYLSTFLGVPNARYSDHIRIGIITEREGVDEILITIVGGVVQAFS